MENSNNSGSLISSLGFDGDQMAEMPPPQLYAAVALDDMSTLGEGTFTSNDRRFSWPPFPRDSNLTIASTPVKSNRVSNRLRIVGNVNQTSGSRSWVEGIEEDEEDWPIESSPQSTRCVYFAALLCAPILISLIGVLLFGLSRVRSDDGNQTIDPALGSSPTVANAEWPSLSPSPMPTRWPTFDKPRLTLPPTRIEEAKPTIGTTVSPSFRNFEETLQPSAIATSSPTEQHSPQAPIPPTSSSLVPSEQRTDPPGAAPAPIQNTLAPSSQPSVSSPATSPVHTTSPISTPAPYVPTPKPLSPTMSPLPPVQPPVRPSMQPSRAPVEFPAPVSAPNHNLSPPPTELPTTQPTVFPSIYPTLYLPPVPNPTLAPSPIVSTLNPTRSPVTPSAPPVPQRPALELTVSPAPGGNEPTSPTRATFEPTSSLANTNEPFDYPVQTTTPSTQPTDTPSSPNPHHTDLPVSMPTPNPSCSITAFPTRFPTLQPTSLNTPSPANRNTAQPSSFSAIPTPVPSVQPTKWQPRLGPSTPSEPGAFPTPQPILVYTPSPLPTELPSLATSTPSADWVTPQPSPLDRRTAYPTVQPSMETTGNPTYRPSGRDDVPTPIPSTTEITIPTERPTTRPIDTATAVPTHHPLTEPSEPPVHSSTSIPTPQPAPPTVPPTVPPVPQRPILEVTPTPRVDQPISVPRATFEPTASAPTRPSPGPSWIPSDWPSLAPSAKLPKRTAAYVTSPAGKVIAPHEPISNRKSSAPEHYFALSENDALKVSPTYPLMRFQCWQNLNETSRNFATRLGYHARTWDKPGTNPLELVSFPSMPESVQSIVDQLGFSSTTWNCWINHYAGFPWDTLTQLNVSRSFETLGYSQATWGESDSHHLKGRRWHELTKVQRLAAQDLCYTQETWDTIPIPRWENISAARQALLGLLESRAEYSVRAIMDDEDSPQYRSFLWLTATRHYYENSSNERLLQLYAMGVFYNGLSGTPDIPGPTDRLRLREREKQQCTWYINQQEPVCNDEGLVERIDLRNLNLYGVLPRELSLMSSSLRWFSVKGNNLHGTIPSELGDLWYLEHMELDSNQFQGTIPTELGNLQHLEIFDVQNNNLTGIIPNNVCDLPFLDRLSADCDTVQCECCDNCDNDSG